MAAWQATEPIKSMDENDAEGTELQPRKAAYVEPADWEDASGRVLDEANWMKCIGCAHLTTAKDKTDGEGEERNNAVNFNDCSYDILLSGTPEFDLLPDVKCSICNLNTSTSQWKAARRCRKCGALVCDGCAQRYAAYLAERISVQLTTEGQRFRKATYRSGGLLCVIMTVLVVLAFSASALVPQQVFIRSLVWYSQCNAPGYIPTAACFLPINSYDSLRTAKMINGFEPLVDVKMNNFRAWMDFVGMTYFAYDFTREAQVSPIARGIFGYGVNDTFTTQVTDLYTDEVPVKLNTFFDVYNLSVTLLMATRLPNASARLLQLANQTAFTSVDGFQIVDVATVDLRTAPALSNITHQFWGVHGPRRLINSTQRLFRGLTSAYSLVELQGDDVVLHTRLNITTPLGTCLDIDPAHKDIDPTDRIGFLRTTGCQMYGQEFDVVPPWFFILAAAVKNVVMILIVQRFFAWIIGGLKSFFRGGRLVRFLGPKAVNWTLTPPLPQIVQRMELFNGVDVYAAAHDKMEKHQERVKAARKREADEKGETHFEEILVAQNAATDFANEDFSVVDVVGVTIVVAPIRVEAFVNSEYYALQRTDRAWVKQWFVNEYIPNHPLGQFQIMNLARGNERADFPLTPSEIRFIIAGHWSQKAGWGLESEYASQSKEIQQIRKLLRNELPGYFSTLPQRKMFAAIHDILTAAHVPPQFVPQLHDVIAKDLWSMCHFGYDYGTQLNQIFSKQTVLLYAIVYMSSFDDAALQAAGLLSMADSVQLATPARLKQIGLASDDEIKADSAVSQEEYATLLRARDALIDALNECSVCRKNIVWDEPSGTEERNEPAAEEAYGGPVGFPWRFYDFVNYFRQIHLGMPQARGFLSPTIQLAHHVVHAAYPNTFFVGIGFLSTFGVLFTCMVSAHHMALREIGTMILPFMHRWVNTGGLVSNLTYTTQLRSIPDWYGIDRATYKAPLVHNLYVGITVVACLSASVLCFVGLFPSAFIIVFVGGFFAASMSAVGAALKMLMLAFDKTGTGTKAVFLNVAGMTLLVSLFFGLIIQTTNNVGYALFLDVFGGESLSSKPVTYWIYDAVGTEYLGRRLSCSLEHMSLDYTSLIGMLSYMALP